MKEHCIALQLAPCLALFSGLAAADTLVVDDDGGPGVDFTDVQSAIDWGAPGDLILVHPGNYPGFTLDYGLTILGTEASDTSVIDTQVTVAGVPFGQRAVLTGLKLESIRVTNNDGHVTLDSLYAKSSNDARSTLFVSRSDDVRVYQCEMWGPTNFSEYSSKHAGEVDESRLEVVDSLLHAGYSVEQSCTDGPAGGHGLVATGASRLALFQTSCIGGNGGDIGFCEWWETYAGDGGDGLTLSGAVTAVIAGQSSDRIEHGPGGYDYSYYTSNDGQPGIGLRAEGLSLVRHSGVTITSQSVSGGATVEAVVPADPFLERLGTLQAGRQQTFSVYGQPGDRATLYLGRSPSIAIDPTQLMDDLVSHERAYDLGLIPASGEASFLFTIPAGFPTGFSFFAQAETVDPAGQRLLTNSMPLVIRHLPQ